MPLDPQQSIQVQLQFPSGRGETYDFGLSIAPVRVIVPVPPMDEATMMDSEFYARLPVLIAEMVEAAFSDYMKIGVTQSPQDMLEG